MMRARKSLVLAALAALLFAAPGLSFAAADDIVASMEMVKGSVTVTSLDKRTPVAARNGMLLHNGDEVIASNNGLASIKFRDGSEIRVFPSSQFKVDAASEGEGQSRLFKYDLKLKAGAIWGKFAKQRREASVTTPTATIGIKGTALRILEQDGKARVALTEGEIEVGNRRETVKLTPGKRIESFGPSETLKDKVQPIPYKLELRSEVKNLEFGQAGKAEAFVTIQLIDVAKGNNVNRSGPVYLRSNYDKINYPADVTLNERGFARVPLIFLAPQPADAQLNGSVYVTAVLDSAQDDDVGEGNLLFKLPPTSTTKKVRVKADTGESHMVR